MKKIIYTFILTLFIVGCGEEKVAKVLQERNGIFYVPNEETPFSGIGESYYLTGQKQHAYHYEDGIRDGKFTTWYLNGQKSHEGSFNEGKDDGPFVAWYENGQQRGQGEFDNGKKDGKFIDWYRDGKKKWEINISDGKKNGSFVAWYENGQKKTEGTFKDEKKNGLLTVWYENGQKKSSSNFSEDKEDGLFVLWYENGQKELEGTANNGKAEGLSIGWDLEGKREFTKYFNDGVEVTNNRRDEESILKNWRNPKENELSDKEFRAKSPTKFVTLTKDFNGDGKLDYAYLMKSTRFNGEGLIVKISTADSFEWLVVKEEDAYQPDTPLFMGVDEIEVGVHKTSCAVYDCEPGEPTEVTLKNTGIYYFVFEKGGDLLYWDSAINNFKEVYLGD